MTYNGRNKNKCTIKSHNVYTRSTMYTLDLLKRLMNSFLDDWGF